MGVAFAVVNAKGGVGKTTSAVNIAAMAASIPKPDGSKRRVLVCDMDQQMNATQQLLGGREVEPKDTLAYHVTRNADLEQIILHDVAFIEGLDLLPSHYQLAYVDESILETGTWLRRKLLPLRSRYDLIVFDCPVHLGTLTRNALAASQGLLIPTQPEKHSVMGLPHLVARARDVFEETEVRNPWAYVIITMVRNTIDHREWVNHVRREYEDGVLDTVIRLNADLGKSATGGLPIVVFDEKCNGFEDYRSATMELLTDLEKNAPRLRVVGTEAAAG